MPGVNTPEGVVVPAAGDTFDYLGEMRRKANSQRTVVPVADRAAADVIASAMATDNRPVSDTNPLVVWNNADKRVEVKNGGGWNDTGRIVRHSEWTSINFSVAGGAVPWDIGPLARESQSSVNDAFVTTNATSGCVTITETGWYSLHGYHIPNGSAGNALTSIKIDGNLIHTGETNGYAWEMATMIPMIKINAGSVIMWYCTATTARTWTSRCRITKVA